MDIDKLHQGLDHLFIAEHHRIVFWYDANREFEAMLNELELDKVTLLRLDEEPALAVKKRLELDDPHGRYLLYAPYDEPDPEQDWLLDMRLYSTTFQADRASMLLQELGLSNLSMREHIAKRALFFSKERLARLKKLIAGNDDADVMDLKMMAVVSRADQADYVEVLIRLFDAMATDDERIESSPKAWREMERLGLDAPFWRRAKAAFGYDEEKPCLSNLLIRLLVADFCQSMESGEVPEALRHLLCAGAKSRANAAICMAQWRDHIGRFSSYDALSVDVASRLNLNNILQSVPAGQLENTFTFEQVERYVMRGMRTALLEGIDDFNYPAFKAMLARRQDGHWLSSNLPSTAQVPRAAYRSIHAALESAAELVVLRQQHAAGFAQSSAAAMAHAYATELYKFDLAYRQFHEAAFHIRSKGWDFLKELEINIEDLYSNWYINKLAMCWNDFIGTGEQPLLNHWRLPDIPNQHGFFQRYIEQPLSKKTGPSRIFVIISDAMRYEVAHELASELGNRYRFKATMGYQLGVLPSYTALGMAALLPHDDLAYRDGGAEVLVDGKRTASLENRKKILESRQATAIKAAQLLKMKREEGRAWIKPWQAIYIYHDRIDATGDTAKTEEQTFQAARETIDEVAALVRYIINTLNGSQVIVTADHGFLFQQRALDQLDKSALEDKPEGALVAKKRYLLGRNLPEATNAWKGSTGITAKASGDMDFWVPKGVNRFHFVGGSRFVHGGAMLQEIIVPVLKVEEMDTEKARKKKAQPVGVQLLGMNHRVVTHRHRFRLLQMDAVGKDVLPVTLQVAIWNEDEAVTQIEPVTFNSVSGDINEREKSIFLTLKGQEYPRAQYYLVLRDAQAGVEVGRYPVTIDLTFSSDFD